MRNKNQGIEVLLPNKFKQKTGVHIVTSHGGKMEGIGSLSTSCTKNKFCQKRKENPENICHYCYANTILHMREGCRKNCEKNSEILTSRILEKSELPILNYSVFRFEAFGDLENETQLINYFNICKANKRTDFALWTKNPAIVDKVIKKGYKKPRNLQIVLSSLKVNEKADANKWKFIDKVFTVYSDDYIKKNEIKINCGAKSCVSCQKCYHKNKYKEINEKLKGAKKYTQ